MRRAFAAIIFVAFLAVLTQAPAFAQGYPIGLGTPTGTVNAGTHRVGDTFSSRLCGPWVPGSAVVFSFNGQFAGQKPADAAGCVNVTITILSPSAISVDDIVSGICGSNTLALTGTPDPRGAGAQATSRITFVLDCTGVTPGQFVAPASPGYFNPAIASYLNPGVASYLPTSQQQQQQQSSVVGAPAAPATPAAGAPAAAAPAASGGRVSFTGANVVRWITVALVLLVIGGAMVAHSARRSRRLA